MSFTESKSNLAKLLSEEGIIVELRSGVDSAFFDTKNRLMVIPEFRRTVSSDVTDLFISHESSHAINTPVNWYEIAEEQKINKGIINVIEDARIEKIIKRKYPGLYSIFYRAYKELYADDFFGLSKIENINNMNLIDRINLHFKVGFLSFISFSEEEKEIVSMVEKTNTFEDVVQVAKLIQDAIQQEYEYSQNEESDPSGKSNEFDAFDQMFEEGGISDKFLNGDFSDTLEDHFRAFTQEYSEQKLKELYSSSNNQSIYVDVPEIKTSDYIIDYRVIQDKLNANFGNLIRRNGRFKTFKSENASIVSYLIKEFNLRKNAEGRKKVKIAKTGDINLNKIYSYKISDDIFKKISKVEKEQNHGLIFFLDWSGSMSSCIEDTIKQLLIMLLFCRKQNIPYEVYAFTTSIDNNSEKKENAHELFLKGFSLMNLFSSRMSNNDFIEMSNYLLSFDGHCFIDPSTNLSISYPPYWFSLGNTPLNHSIMISPSIVEEFQTRTKVQIVNSIYLTDGDSHDLSYSYVDSNYDALRYSSINSYGKNIYIRDKKTKQFMLFEKNHGIFQTNNCVSFIKKISNFRMFAFRLITKRELNYYSNLYGRENLLGDFNKNNCVEVPSKFDKYYFVKTNASSNIDTELSEGFSNKTITNMSKEFSKTLNNKINTKVFLKKFIEFIG